MVRAASTCYTVADGVVAAWLWRRSGHPAPYLKGLLHGRDVLQPHASVAMLQAGRSVGAAQQAGCACCVFASHSDALRETTSLSATSAGYSAAYGSGSGAVRLLADRGSNSQRLIYREPAQPFSTDRQKITMHACGSEIESDARRGPLRAPYCSSGR